MILTSATKQAMVWTQQPGGFSLEFFAVSTRMLRWLDERRFHNPESNKILPILLLCVPLGVFAKENIKSGDTITLVHAHSTRATIVYGLEGFIG